MTTEGVTNFAAEYAAQRAAEGRGHAGEDLLSLPYLRSGPLARQWGVRARSFEAFRRHVIRPHALQRERPLSVLDLGAGNGWLSHRLALEGHKTIALDIRADAVDGLGAAESLEVCSGGRMSRLLAAFDDIPLDPSVMDVAVFNASLHYALDLEKVLREAARVVRPGGVLAIVDSPFYAGEAQGAAMVAEKRAQAADRFGDRAGVLLALSLIHI